MVVLMMLAENNGIIVLSK